MKRKLFVGCLVVLAIGYVMMVQAGDLNPTAAPSSTMKTLDEVEPRTPIDTIPIVIDQPGSYYLTGNFTCTTARAIDVVVDDVTIDLCGYTLTGSGTAGDFGIYMSSRVNIEIRNGTVRDFDEYGIFATGNVTRNIQVRDIRAIHNGRCGIYLYGYKDSTYKGGGHQILRCSASDNGHVAGAYGIYAGDHSIVENCTSTQNVGYGIYSTVCNAIRGNTVGCNTGLGIRGGYYSTVQDNVVQGNTGGGIYGGRGSVIQGNSVNGNENEHGIEAGYGSVIKNNTVCNGVNNSYSGIYANYGAEVIGNGVYENEGWGIRAYYGCLVKDNIIRGNNKVNGTGCGGLYCYGYNRVKNNHLVTNNYYNIFVGSSRSTLEDNSIYGTASDYGIYFDYSNNFYKNNVSSGCGTNFGGTLPTGSLDGGNVGF